MDKRTERHLREIARRKEAGDRAVFEVSFDVDTVKEIERKRSWSGLEEDVIDLGTAPAGTSLHIERIKIADGKATFVATFNDDGGDPAARSWIEPGEQWMLEYTGFSL